jgi:hypothetical protein
MDGFGDGGAGALLAGFIEHAVGFAEHDRGDAVVIHGGADVGDGEDAGGLLEAEDVIDGVVDVVAVGSLAGDVSAGHEGHGGEGGDRRRGTAIAGVGGPGAGGGVLVRGQPLKAAVDGGLDLGGDLLGRGVVDGGEG